MERNNHFKLAIFDLDGTLTRERSIWEYIHKKLGKWYGFAEKYQQRFLAGEISYDQFCELDARVWKGMRVEDLIEIAKTVPFHSGTDELITYVKHKGLKLGMVSSGLSVLSTWVHQKYGFDYSVSNDLVHENGVLTGKVRIQVHYDQKAVWVNMLQMAGFSVAFNSTCQDLEQIADVCIKNQNLADIIPELPL
jgi:phosphoserine phosphatase